MKIYIFYDSIHHLNDERSIYARFFSMLLAFVPFYGLEDGNELELGVSKVEIILGILF